MTTITLYHNPGCSKSRGAREILERAGVQFEVVEYLSRPLSRTRLLQLIELLGLPPAELVRKDAKFDALGLKAEHYLEAEAVADLLVRYPQLMQRPIAVRGNRAVLARPSERIAEILHEERT
ncbi:MAG: ArsC/Spx/MgsR family protein [Pseudomonadales bacterium]|nr:arsenate reductase (glutaredoxin) [Pseudomonadales bacterium]